MLHGLNKKCLCLQHNLKANHNKDYSVVKTFKTEGKPFVFFFGHLQKNIFHFYLIIISTKKRKTCVNS